MVGILFMSCIGLLILFISVSNFVVLFMVQGERRSKEIPFGYEIKYIYRIIGKTKCERCKKRNVKIRV